MQRNKIIGITTTKSDLESYSRDKLILDWNLSYPTPREQILFILINILPVLSSSHEELKVTQSKPHKNYSKLLENIKKYLKENKEKKLFNFQTNTNNIKSLLKICLKSNINFKSGKRTLLEKVRKKGKQYVRIESQDHNGFYVVNEGVLILLLSKKYDEYLNYFIRKVEKNTKFDITRFGYEAFRKYLNQPEIFNPMAESFNKLNKGIYDLNKKYVLQLKKDNTLSLFNKDNNKEMILIKNYNFGTYNKLLKRTDMVFNKLIELGIIRNTTTNKEIIEDVLDRFRTVSEFFAGRWYGKLFKSKLLEEKSKKIYKKVKTNKL